MPKKGNIHNNSRSSIKCSTIWYINVDWQRSMYVMGMNAFFVFTELVIKAKRMKRTHTNISVRNFTPKSLHSTMKRRWNIQHINNTKQWTTPEHARKNKRYWTFTQHKRYYLALKSHKESKNMNLQCLSVKDRENLKAVSWRIYRLCLTNEHTTESDWEEL